MARFDLVYRIPIRIATNDMGRAVEDQEQSRMHCWPQRSARAWRRPKRLHAPDDQLSYTARAYNMACVIGVPRRYQPSLECCKAPSTNRGREHPLSLGVGDRLAHQRIEYALRRATPSVMKILLPAMN